MKISKSLESDGLPVEFYITFWGDIYFNEFTAYHETEISPIQKQGIKHYLIKKETKVS